MKNWGLFYFQFILQKSEKLSFFIFKHLFRKRKSRITKKLRGPILKILSKQERIFNIYI